MFSSAAEMLKQALWSSAMLRLWPGHIGVLSMFVNLLTGWMGGQIDGWMDGWMDRWIDDG
jgi:hypothetical protein